MLYLGQANQWREMARWQRMTSRSYWTRSSDRPRLRGPTRLWVRSRVLRRWFFCQAASLCGMTHQSQQARTLGLLLGQGPMEAVRLRPVYLQPIQQAPVGGLWTCCRALLKGCVKCDVWSKSSIATNSGTGLPGCAQTIWSARMTSLVWKPYSLIAITKKTYQDWVTESYLIHSHFNKTANF